MTIEQCFVRRIPTLEGELEVARSAEGRGHASIIFGDFVFMIDPDDLRPIMTAIAQAHDGDATRPSIEIRTASGESIVIGSATGAGSVSLMSGPFFLDIDGDEVDALVAALSEAAAYVPLSLVPAVAVATDNTEPLRC